MELSWDLLFLIISGCLGGFISGLLGVGGGIIFVPILDYFLIKQGVTGGELVQFTLANSFLAILFSGVAGSFRALINKQINMQSLLPVALSAIVFVLLTSWAIGLGTWYTPFFFKIFFCAMLLFTLIRTYLHIEADGSQENVDVKLGVLIGSLTGVVSGLSGLGGGIIMIPLFMILGQLTIKRASVLSLAVIPLLALPNVIYYAFSTPDIHVKGATGYIVWSLVLPIILGVLMTIKAGLIVARKTSPKTIKAIFAVFIIITIIKTLSSLLH